MDRFIIMTEWGDALAPLTDEQVGKFFRIMTNYAKGVEVEITDDKIALVWGLIKPNMDRMNNRYIKSVENGKKGGAPNGNQNARKKTEEQPNNNLNQPETTQNNLNQPETTQNNLNQPLNKIKENKIKENKIISSYGDFDERFTKIVNLFPSSKQNGLDDAYHYTWQFLDEEEKRTAEKMSAIYIERNQTTQNYIKSVGKYFEERFWNIDKVSLDFIKNKNNSGKTYQQRVSEVIV